MCKVTDEPENMLHIEHLEGVLRKYHISINVLPKNDYRNYQNLILINAQVKRNSPVRKKYQLRKINPSLLNFVSKICFNTEF